MALPYISYAQNFEDVILRRIFGTKSDGFYVDVGACHPTYDSVTKSFYELGWNGINIEPVPQMTGLFEQERKRDINLPVAISDSTGEIELYIPPSKANSTCNEKVAASYGLDNALVPKILVKTLTLNQIWKNHAQGRDVDFLKVDVEGLEYEVIKGCDFSLVTPKIIVIESTIPQTQNASYHSWEHMLSGSYDFFYFDGLNRFYHRKDFEIDYNEIAVPPNVFDHFLKYSESKALQDIRDLEIQIDENCDYIASLENSVQKDKAEVLNTYKKLQILQDKANRDTRHFAELQSSLNAKDADVLEVQSQLQQLKDKVLEDAKQFTALEDALNAKDTDILEAQNQLQQLQDKVLEDTKQFTALEDALNAKDADIFEAQNQLQQLQDKVLEDTRHFAELQSVLKVKDSTILRAQSRIQQLQDKISDDARYILSMSKPED